MGSISMDGYGIGIGIGSLLTIFLALGAALLIPSLSPVAAEEDWKKCGDTLPQACGETIYNRVVLNKGPPPTDDCCAALVRIGKPCHDAYAEAHVKDHLYKRSAIPLLKRSDELWKECVVVANFVFPPPVAPMSSQ